MSTETTELTDLRSLARRLARDEGLLAVAEALERGDSATVDGAWGSSKALALCAIARVHAAPMIVVLPRAADVEAMVEDLRSLGDRVPAVFPAVEEMGPKRVGVGDPGGRRLAVVKALLGPEPPRAIVTTIQAMLQPVASPDRIRRDSRSLARGQTIDLDGFIAWLTGQGWQRRDAVELPGEFSLRGGIVDLFPPDANDPLRIELFGDRIESIRKFSVESQRSLREIERCLVTALSDALGLPAPIDDLPVHFAEVVPQGSYLALVEPIEIREEGKRYLQRLESTDGIFALETCWRKLVEHPTVVLSTLPHASTEAHYFLGIESVERLSGDVTRLRDELDNILGADQLLVACHNEGERERLREVMAESRLSQEGRLVLAVGRIAVGFRWVSEGLVAISDHQLFVRAEPVRPSARRRFQGKAIDSFVDLHEGDYVVHLAHGIGIFRGMKMLEKTGQLEEHLVIEFAEGSLVYVPASKIELVQKYVGASQTAPRLSRVGGLSWERSKRRVQEAVQDLAGELLDLQATRQIRPGIAFPPDSPWQQEFEAAFPYTETEDQITTMEEIRADMQTNRPMDRLICGDVGYGKTELAMRAAFKAVDFGKQVAVLVPTTVLAQQHLRTFRQRMAEFPFVVEALSRFQTKGEQRKTLQRAADGAVDILIGTHRLLSEDVAFRELGMVIIDEEQRFGVADKERLKRLRSQVDILTLSATPIPRTLHSALLGIRDISNLESPPPNRLAVETRIARFDTTLVRHAILRELNRDGQIYFVHNRVQDIHRIADRITRIVPEVRIAIVHGQMPEEQIEEGMVAFLTRRADLLLATTIIESGLDIPNANTMFINEGDRYGLADLHQLRGRVGRSTHRAYCYVLIDEDKVMTADAQRRLKAVEEYSMLGAGFHIALRDLEIRGAGNILGTEQSGHICAVGYELYCQLLENAVRTMKKQPLRTILDVTVELPWKAYLPHAYLPGERYRIDTYRRLARVRQLDELEQFRRDLVDRFGPLPEVAQNLIDLAELRILAHVWQVESIRTEEQGYLVLSYRDARRIQTLERLRAGELIVADAKQAYVRVPPSRQDAGTYVSLLKRLLQPM